MQKLLLIAFWVLSFSGMAQTVAFQVTAPSTGSDANSSVLENAGTATITLVRTGSTAGQTTVDVVLTTTAAGGNAVNGTDLNYTTQTATFADGASTATVSVTIINNSQPQPARFAEFRLANVTGGTLGTAVSHLLFIRDDDQVPTVGNKAVEFQFTGSYPVGTPGTNSAEIVAHDPTTQRLYVANSIANRLEILDFSNPAAMTSVASINMATYGAGINSVAVRNGVVATAVESANQAPGKVVFLDKDGNLLSQVTTGVLPDMVAFSPDGRFVVTADEGEPNNAYTVDPEGTVTVIDISGGVATLQQSSVTTVNFNAFDSQLASLRASGIRIYGPNATVSKDLEPEYVTFSNDSRRAWITLQENNAIAVLDLITKQITNIFPLGLKDHSLAANSLDASDQMTGNPVVMMNWNIKGMYQPDAIAYFEVGGTPYIVSANEGDSRAYAGYDEEIRVSSGSYPLNTTNFPNAALLKRNSAVGRLQLTRANLNTTTNVFDEIHALGTRSFSIWNANTGAQVFDSGNLIEKIVLEHPTWGPLFNADHSSNTIKNRSDNKGPEPEGVAIALIAGKTYAFVSLERVGGVMVFDVSNPTSPIFSDYINSRVISPLGGDRGGEGIAYIAAQDSPTRTGMIVVGNEISSTVSVYSLKDVSVTVAPIATTATAITSSGFTANWNAVPGAASYLLDVSADNFATFIPGFNGLSVTATSQAIPGLTPNTAYVYRVRAVNAFGNSARSNTISATTLKAQAITFAALANRTQGDAGFSLTATAGSGLPVAFSTTTPTRVSVSGNQVTLVSPGRATIVASQIGNAEFDAAPPVSQSFCINPSRPVITVSNLTSDTPTLTSSAPSGNQWFINGIAIPSANSTTLPASQPGVYSVVSIVEGCASEPSTGFPMVFTGDVTADQELLVAYPNPTRDVFHINLNRFEKNREIEVEVFDYLGRRVIQQRAWGGEEATIGMGSQNNGTYVVRVQQNTRTAFIKLIKQ